MKNTSCPVAVLIASVALCMAAPAVRAQDDGTPGEVLRNSNIVKQLTASRAHRLGVSAGPDPDTVYVGKSYANHTAPDNYLSLIHI